MKNTDFSKLKQIRHIFLDSHMAGTNAYWDSAHTLDLYDATFSRRIEWKWNAVWGELAELQWSMPTTIDTIVDWGCGSGVASETLLTQFPHARQLNFFVHDHSQTAMEFTAQKLKEHFKVAAVRHGLPNTPSPNILLLVSHVITELAELSFTNLLHLAQSCGAVVWVEPGTKACSQKLQVARECLRATKRVVAPCLHQNICGLIASGNKKDWCHFFAKPPQEVFHSAKWAEFSRVLGIDIRSLPVSFLVAENKKTPIDSVDDQKNYSTKIARVIGKPRLHKGCAHVCSCQMDKVSNEILQRRDFPNLVEELERGVFKAVYQSKAFSSAAGNKITPTHGSSE